MARRYFGRRRKRTISGKFRRFSKRRMGFKRRPRQAGFKRRVIKALAARPRPERKYVTADSGATAIPDMAGATSTGNFVDFTNIAQGDTVSTREGNRIEVSKISFEMWLQQSTATVLGVNEYTFVRGYFGILKEAVDWTDIATSMPVASYMMDTSDKPVFRPKVFTSAAAQIKVKWLWSKTWKFNSRMMPQVYFDVDAKDAAIEDVPSARPLTVRRVLKSFRFRKPLKVFYNAAAGNGIKQNVPFLLLFCAPETGTVVKSIRWVNRFTDA